ncbi:MAG: LysE family translocator [Prevotellaceae bacterium]|jgi:threonine/homoserine/homoserine lactone efflux protein|nr:LysE family translocator [Prevotellaceae bacterium]
MVEILLSGFIIGICVSMPVGPIAILCIQKTLNKGRRHGFVTGAGAACSDVFYAILATFSMSFLLSFIETHSFWFQLVGSLVLLFVGFLVFRSNPVKELSPTQEIEQTYVQDFVTAFFLTISNPLIILLLIGLFARFRFITEATSFVQSIAGLSAVFCGALFWWLLLVSFVSLFRSRFNVRGLWLVNKITAVIIWVVAFLGIVYSFLGERIV